MNHSDQMSRLLVAGVEYVPQQAVLEELEISRQTLWRWRRLARIPTGRRHARTGQIVFTRDEYDRIQEFADRLESVGQ